MATQQLKTTYITTTAFVKEAFLKSKAAQQLTLATTTPPPHLTMVAANYPDILAMITTLKHLTTCGRLIVFVRVFYPVAQARMHATTTPTL
jgi:hypothetical protein